MRLSNLREATRKALRELSNGQEITPPKEAVKEFIQEVANEMCRYHVWYNGNSYLIGRMRHEDILPRLDEWCIENRIGEEGNEFPVYLFCDNILFLIRVPTERGGYTTQNYTVNLIQKFDQVMMLFGDRV